MKYGFSFKVDVISEYEVIDTDNFDIGIECEDPEEASDLAYSVAWDKAEIIMENQGGDDYDLECINAY